MVLDSGKAPPFCVRGIQRYRIGNALGPGYTTRQTGTISKLFI